ncbi:MAG: ATP synthase F1 subunit delta [Leptospirales bacterium]
MNTDSAAYRYSTALSEIEGADLKKMEESLQTVVTLFADNPELKSFYESPKVPAEKKKTAIESAFRKAIDGEVLSLLLVLINKGRTTLLDNISRGFTELVDIAFNRVRPLITLSRDFPEKDIKAIVNKVEELIKNHGDQFGVVDGKTVEFIPRLTTDESLLGGVILRVGDYQWDSSVKTYLREWKLRVHGSRIDLKTANSLSD